MSTLVTHRRMLISDGDTTATAGVTAEVVANVVADLDTDENGTRTQGGLVFHARNGLRLVRSCRCRPSTGSRSC